MLASWFANGYAGALGWQYNEYEGRLDEVRTFGDEHACETRF